jgi:hypothetical protein
MADFGVDFASLSILAGVPLTAAGFLLVAAIAGLITLATKAHRARHIAFRAMAIALVSLVFPLVPFGFLESGVKLDADLIHAWFWLWLMFFVGGCWWLARPARVTRHRRSSATASAE